MKLYILGFVGALIIMLAIIGGCTDSKNTDDTQEKILDNCKPIVEKWFQSNMSDAKDISVELCEFFKKKEFYDVVTGDYYKAGKKYCYWFNVETEEFCSEEYYEILVQYMQKSLEESLEINCREIDMPLADAVINGKNGYSSKCKWAYHRFLASELETIATKEMSKADREIRIIVAEPDAIIANIEVLDILKEHTNWTFVLQEARDALEYRVYYSDGKYHIARAFLDDRGILRYELNTI